MLYILCILYISKYFMLMKYTYFSAYIFNIYNTYFMYDYPLCTKVL